MNRPGHPAAVEGVVVEDLDDEVCLYRPGVESVVVLNSSAADVWRLADGDRSVEEIVDLLAVAYGTRHLADDVHRTIDELGRLGFLHDDDR